MKTPVLAMLLAGATAQKRNDLRLDKAAAFDPQKPADLEGCTNEAVGIAKGKEVAAKQALDGLNGVLKPLDEAVVLKITAKKEAIKLVLAKDELDKVAIAADYTAAAAEITARATYLDKVATYNAAKKALSEFDGEVTQNSGNPDQVGTVDVDEAKKQIVLVKTNGGALKIAKAKLAAAKIEQGKLATAFDNGEKALIQWKAEIAAEKLKLTGLSSDENSKKGTYDLAVAAVKTLVDDYNTKLGIWNEKVALAAVELNNWKALEAAETAVQGKIDALGAAAANVPAWATQTSELVTAAKEAKATAATFISKYKLFTTDEDGSFTKTDPGTDCKTASKVDQAANPNGADTQPKCRTECMKMKYLEFTTKFYTAGDTDYYSDWIKYFNDDDKKGDLPLIAKVGGCTGFSFTSTPSAACQIFHTATPAQGGVLTGANCWIRKQLDTSLVATQDAWKVFYKKKVVYDNKLSAYNTEIGKGTGWAAYEVKNKVERKRLALVAEYTKEKAKVTAKKDALKDVGGAVTLADAATAAALNNKNNANTAITNLAYYGKVTAKDTASANYDAAKAAHQLVKDKIARIEAIEKHMRDVGNGNKGTLLDLSTAKSAKDTEITAADGLEKKVETLKADRVKLAEASTGAWTKVKEAKLAWEGKNAAAVQALKDVKTPIEAVDALRLKVKEANTALKEANAAANGKKGEIVIKEAEIKGLTATLNLEIEKCKGLKFDAFEQALAERKAARASTLKTIEKLIDANKLAMKAHGLTGGRCEKPQSNGDRLRRGKCTADTDCCGAATGRMKSDPNGPLITIEVCQDKGAKQWGYVPPRAPLAETDPPAVDWDFKCIQGAFKLAGAASAFLASAYMMA